MTYPFFAHSRWAIISTDGVRAFGTDGEKAFCEVFSRACFCSGFDLFYTCLRNIKAKLSGCNIPSYLSVKILDDVFGKKVGDTFVEGLVDATDDEDFREKLSSMQESWQSLGTTSSCNLEKFIKYFDDNKVCDTMSKSLRIECGFIKKVREVIQEQEREVEQAVISRGKYQL